MSDTSIPPVAEWTSSIGLGASDRHRLLAAERRRIALRVLDEEGRRTSLRELASKVAARESRPDSEDRVAVSLHHAHLPLMADLGVVEYDHAARRVELHRALLDGSSA